MTEYMHRPFKLTRLKKAFSKWQYELEGKAWNTLYLENHDHPRIISRYGDDKRFHRESGTMLAVCYLFQQGTPFIYQGQEIGMTNIRLESIDQYVDVSSRTNFHRFHINDPIEKRMERIYLSSRDSARTPMQWDDSENAGFTTGKPWFYVNPNYTSINVRAEEADEYSILNFYRKCLSYRKKSDVVLWGTYKEYFRGDNYIYMYERCYKGKKILIVCSFADHDIAWRLPRDLAGKKGKLVICNYPSHSVRILRPYEARVYELRDR